VACGLVAHDDQGRVVRRATILKMRRSCRGGFFWVLSQVLWCHHRFRYRRVSGRVTGAPSPTTSCRIGSRRSRGACRADVRPGKGPFARHGMVVHRVVVSEDIVDEAGDLGGQDRCARKGMMESTLHWWRRLGPSSEQAAADFPKLAGARRSAAKQEGGLRGRAAGRGKRAWSGYGRSPPSTGNLTRIVRPWAHR